MKLLFITQKVDKNDDVLGVYHRWIDGLSKHFEKISVICLQKGQIDLPSNVSVYSLGKELIVGSRWRYAVRFLRLIWQLRHDYDRVFVHMNPEYIILGGLLWKLSGKKIALWYAHYLSNFKLRIAVWFANRVVTSIRMAFPFPTKKLQVLQQGIDTNLFSPAQTFRSPSDALSVLFLGRIAPVKNLDVLVRAIQLARQRSLVKLSIVGAPTLGRSAERGYYMSVKQLVDDLGLAGLVDFHNPIANKDTPAIYRKHDLFVNLTVTGSFDKSTLEAMACGIPVLVSNLAFRDILGPTLADQLMFKEADHRDLADKISRISALGAEDREKLGEKLREIIVRKHDLTRLVTRLSETIREV
ncbi:MAG: glycosyltransferase family 4 protein [Patescibacteria group bacterium]